MSSFQCLQINLHSILCSFSLNKILLQFNPKIANTFLVFLEELDWLLADTKYLKETDL